MSIRSIRPFECRQQGAVLVVSLLLLLVMTVLALGASQATRMQERMASNARDHDLAFQSAEAGLRAGERFIDDPALTSAPVPCATARCQVYEPGVLTTALSLTYVDQAFLPRDPWWNTNAWDYADTDEISGAGLVRDDPQFYIEEIEEVTDSLTIPPTGPPPSRIYYRVTSRAEGGTDTAQVVLQSTYARRFN
jgi:type IV pilus assembly protein PilX